MNFEKGHFTMSEETFSELCEDQIGLCIACGEEYSSCLEPDASNVECESCEKDTVFGVEELLISGGISFDEGDE